MYMLKGQIIFEFIIAAVLLFAVVIYIINYLSSSVSTFRTNFYSDDLESKAMQISEILTHDNLTGLAKAWPFLDYTKIQTMNDSCNTADGYTDLLKKLDLYPRYKIKIQINETLTNKNLLDCGPVMPKKITRAEIKRYAISDDKIVTLSIGVW